MDLDAVRAVVDGLARVSSSRHMTVSSAGAEPSPIYSEISVSDHPNANYEVIRTSFNSGHLSVWHLCKAWKTQLIREAILSDKPLDPYFSVLDRIQDAVRNKNGTRDEIEGSWGEAIRGAYEDVQRHDWGTAHREKVYSREFEVAKAAKSLRQAGFSIQLSPNKLYLEASDEKRLLGLLEELICKIGGLRVAELIFSSLEPLYDLNQQRYHLVRNVSTTGGGTAQIPWGYLLQLAIKHASTRGSYPGEKANWSALCALAQSYCCLIDVQPYISPIFGSIDANAIIPLMQEMAIYDTIFRINQIRPSDVVSLAAGMFDWLDMNVRQMQGWSIADLLAVTAYLTGPVFDVRGPIIIRHADIRRNCPTVAPEVLDYILDDILSHPFSGANQNFLQPSDAPKDSSPEHRDFGLTFPFRPLLRHPGNRYVMIDRSVCAPGFLEAILSALRPEIAELDKKVGASVERLVISKLKTHGVSTLSGDYDVGDTHGECDIVVPTSKAVIFCELKKKALTRQARAGSDVHLLLDLAESLVIAQAQAGGHELVFDQEDHLVLVKNGVRERLERQGREIERVAMSLFDFGSLQDRIVLKQLLEATLNATFSANDRVFNKRIAKLNRSINDIRMQVAKMHPDQAEVSQPFFNCWFISAPQLFVMLDDVHNDKEFQEALWSTRSIVTGSSDFYRDFAMMKSWKQGSTHSS